MKTAEGSAHARLQDQQPQIEKALGTLQAILLNAINARRHGAAGIRFTIHDGEIRTIFETTEFTTK